MKKEWTKAEIMWKREQDQNTGRAAEANIDEEMITSKNHERGKAHLELWGTSTAESHTRPWTVDHESRNAWNKTPVYHFGKEALAWAQFF